MPITDSNHYREMGGALSEFYTNVKPKMNDFDILARCTILLETLDYYRNKEIQCIGMDVSRRSANGAKDNALAEGFWRRCDQKVLVLLPLIYPVGS
eukprot:scaffold1386_cov77-Cyclotella_meneghiniana.AAC.5